jgi:hypothetical protein
VNHWLSGMLIMSSFVGVAEGQDRSCSVATTQPANGWTYSWQPSVYGSSNSLGDLVITFVKTKQSYRVPFSVAPSNEPLVLQRASCAPSETKVTSDLTFKTGAKQSELLVTLNAQRDGVTVEFRGENQFAVNFLTMANWPAALDPQNIAIPYYSFPIAWFGRTATFANAYWDYTASQATILSATKAEYRALSDGRRNGLHEKLIVKISPNLDDVLPDIPNSKSPYLAEIAGRTVLDIWGPKFSVIASTLAKLQGAGLKDCIALIHVWQHDGYDTGLPEHYPANAALGGEDALSGAVRAGEAAGCLVGLHENYVDYYPNYPRFDPKAVALDAKGQPQKAWLNASVPIQSLAARPELYVKNAAAQSAEIHRRYHTSASFIDVNSSTFPWWRADLDASASRAGMFSVYRDASVGLWEFERKTHGGPVFGEGKEHWFWSGQLDGVEAQLGAEDIKVDKPAYPLFVDFDLLKIHPLQVNHGMGYYSRWLPKGRTIQESMLLDAYRMQEIAYGHAPFIGAELWNNIPQVLVEQNLIGCVARRYGTAAAQVIRYEVNGAWTGTNAATAAHDWSRAEVTYSNGVKIAANAQTDPLSWEGLSLPQNGWAAKGPGLLAYTALVGGHIADYAETPDSYFANARNQSDLQYSGFVAEPKVTQFVQTGSHAAEIQVAWNVLEQPGSENLTNFVHFIAADGSIAFGADHLTGRRTSQWIPGQTESDTFPVRIPAAAADGSYSLRVGLYSPATGARMVLLGVNDGASRYILGTLKVSGGGSKLTFEAANPAPRVDDPRLNATGRPVDFGVIKTDGMISLVRNTSGWVLRAYPASRNVMVTLDSKRFPPPQSVTCPAGAAKTQTPRVSGGSWSVQTIGSTSCSW